jgi:UTP--glucose-1-phosphate uridylyltransferase
VDRVLEKPTPTVAEQKLIVPGLRAGHYLCFFGMHLLTPTVMQVLRDLAAESSGAHLSDALNKAAERERYLACELQGRRYDIGAQYGLFTAQLALALSGKDRDEILEHLVEMLAQT